MLFTFVCYMRIVLYNMLYGHVLLIWSFKTYGFIKIRTAVRSMSANNRACRDGCVCVEYTEYLHVGQSEER